MEAHWEIPACRMNIPWMREQGGWAKKKRWSLFNLRCSSVRWPQLGLDAPLLAWVNAAKNHTKPETTESKSILTRNLASVHTCVLIMRLRSPPPPCSLHGQIAILPAKIFRENWGQVGRAFRWLVGGLMWCIAANFLTPDLDSNPSNYFLCMQNNLACNKTPRGDTQHTIFSA